MSLKVFGRPAFEKAINRGFELAEVAEAILDEMRDWEVVTPGQMGIVTFRYAPPGMPAEQADWLNGELVRAMIADGFAMISSTILRGKTVLRMCTINPRTTEADIQETLGKLDRMGQNLSPDSQR
jgi:glutamate/tyrosine decarboxylase-like PLP-dependent enzyme